MTEARTIGEVLPTVITSASQPQTVSQQPLTDELRKLDLATLPKRLDDQTMATLTELANCRLPPLVSCADGKFLEAMAVMQASLPRRASDGVSGEIQIETYQRMLGDRPKAAIDHLVERALRTCKWFPTIAECLAILGEWQRNDGWQRKREAVRARVGSEVHARFDDAMAALEARQMPQEQIDTLPAQWRRIAVERCYLWALSDGQFIARPDTAGMSEDELSAHRTRVAAMQEEGLL